MSDLESVLRLAREGRKVFPVKPRAKERLTEHGCLDATDSLEQIREWARKYPGCNWGMATGRQSGVFVLDFDGDAGRAAHQKWVAEHGSEWTQTRAGLTANGEHLWYRYPEHGEIRNSAGNLAPGVDVRGEGGYIVIPPSIHPSGKAYTWATAPDAPLLDLKQFQPLRQQPKNGNGISKRAGGARIPAGQRNDVLFRLGSSMRRKGMDEVAIAAALLAHNAQHCSPPLTDTEIRRIAASIDRYAPGAAVNQYADDDLALRFTDQHAQDLRYVARWGRWMYYRGSRWMEDNTLDVFSKARVLCRTASDELITQEKLHLAKTMKSAPTVAAVERLARADRRHAATTEQWDADAMWLGLPGAICDLRTGAVRPQRPEDYLTKTKPIMPADTADCPLWMAFLTVVTNHEPPLAAYLQRVAGYCLTGLTDEQALFFFWGPGGNGKTVFCSTLRSVLGDYAQVAAIDTFLETKNEQHPTNMAALRGARLVVATEPKAGQSWDENKIKALTGKEVIRARYMRQDEFEYKPELKLIFQGNTKPSLRRVDPAFRRRMNLIPFTARIAESDRIRDLDRRLEAEWPAILRWAIQGTLAWQEQGLNPPAIVTDATDEYMHTEDAITTWMEECCIVSPQATSTKASVLHASYRAWAERAKEFVLSQKRFSQELRDHGLPNRRSNGIIFDGIQVMKTEREA